MKLYANNGLLAEYQLDIAFAILRNEGRQPVDAMALAYDLLVGGIDTTTTQKGRCMTTCGRYWPTTIVGCLLR